MKLIDSLGCTVVVGDKVRVYFDKRMVGFGWVRMIFPDGVCDVRGLADDRWPSCRVGDHGPRDLPEARLFGPHDEDAE